MTQGFENGDEPAKRIRQVQVIFLRHGEREDETEGYDKHRRTSQERIDPALTVLGHQQALGAWRKILAYVPNDKPIMVASSPLRRCIGTAMMIAAAAASPYDGMTVRPKFVLPTTENASDQERTEDSIDADSEQTASSTTIPMLVMNGLGDCAAQMKRMGGIGEVVKAGWLACAASPGNDCLQNEEEEEEEEVDSTPLQHSLQTIATNATNLQTRWGGNVTVTESCKLQFWRESKYHYYESPPMSDLSKMTEPRTLHEHAGEMNHRATHTDLSRTPPHMPKNAPSRDERFDQAVERAVLLTAHAGLDTCILVTHREAIRWIETHYVRRQAPPKTAEELEQYKIMRKRDPKLQATRTYCCVGDYTVTVDLTNDKKARVLSWENKKIVPWSQLERDHE